MSVRLFGARLMGHLDELGIGQLATYAAERHGSVHVAFDQPLDLAPELGLNISYETVAMLVEATHARLASAGVKSGERVAVVRPNSFDTVILACALARLGALPALISAAVPKPAMHVLLKRLGPSTVLSDTLTVENLEISTDDPNVRQLLTLGTGREGLGHPCESDLPAPPPHPRDPNEPTMIAHTSGTTGTPKLVVHSARSLMAQAKPQYLYGIPLTRGGDRVAAAISWAHTRSIVGWAAIAIRGVPFLALAQFDAEHVADPLTRFKPTLVETHPNGYLGWASLADSDDGPFANVKVFFSTFDSAHPDTIRRFLAASRRRFALWVQVYGQSETGPIAMRLYPKGIARLRDDGRDVGRPIPGFTRIRTTDANAGSRSRGGAVGIVEVATDGLALRYHGQPELTASQTNGGWWRTGDLGQLTPRRTLRFLDRAVDEIPGVASGVALEDALLRRIAQAREVVVLPIGNNEVLPVVCTYDDEPLDRDRWREETYDLPVLRDPLQLRWAELPLTSTLKVRRLELRRQLAERGLSAQT